MSSSFNYSNAPGQFTISSFESEMRSTVPYFVYLPPNWNPNGNYSLLLFLHGQGGDETTFQKYVKADQLNEWILSGELNDIVIAGIRGDNDRDKIQWFTPENESLLIPELNGEFIQFCRDHFKAGGEKEGVSLEGHSRGGGGALHYLFKYPNSFKSVISMGYVSDYTLAENKELALKNKAALIESGVQLYMEIGTEDRFVRNQNRKASFAMHDYLDEIKLPHSFEYLHGVEHGFDSFWHHYSDEETQNGLRHLKRHCEGL
ncbi:alpha/beta hydrolase [Ancylomarina sp. YFZ004]